MHKERVLIKLEDTNAYVRDMHSKALLPTSRKEADEYTVKTKMMQTAKDNAAKIEQLEEKVAFLDTKLDRIISMLMAKE